MGFALASVKGSGANGVTRDRLCFKWFRNAAITIAGIELMHRIRKGQVGLARLGVQGRVALTICNAVPGA